jgi:type I restriction enzyme M protein
METEQAWRVPIDQIKERNYNLDLKNPHSVTEDHGDPEELLADLQAAEQKAADLRDQLKAILSEALLR